MKKHIGLGIFLGICLSLITLYCLLSVNNDNSKVLKHTFNNQLLVHLPHSTKVMETPIIERGQLLYSVYLDDQTLLIRGYIQIWLNPRSASDKVFNGFFLAFIIPAKEG